MKLEFKSERNYHGSYTFTLDIQQKLTFILGSLPARWALQSKQNSLNEGPPLSAKSPARPQIRELISEFALEGHRGPAEWLFLRGREGKDGGGEGQEEASRVAVMAFQGKLRRRELFGSGSAKCWPLFTQVVSASLPSHTRHNSFSSQSASEHRLSDCHCPWFITPSLCHWGWVSSGLCHSAKSLQGPLVSQPGPLPSATALTWYCGSCGYHNRNMKVMVCQHPSSSLCSDLKRLVQ